MIDKIYYNGEIEWIRGNKYKLVKDHKSLRNLINTAIYDNTSLLYIANGLLLGDNDKSVGLFIICLNFVILKSELFLFTE